MSTKSTPNTKNLTYHNLSLQFAKILINLCPMLELGLEPNYVGMEHTSLIITITDPGSILIKFSKMLSWLSPNAVAGFQKENNISQIIATWPSLILFIKKYKNPSLKHGSRGSPLDSLWRWKGEIHHGTKTLTQSHLMRFKRHNQIMPINPPFSQFYPLTQSKNQYNLGWVVGEDDGCLMFHKNVSCETISNNVSCETISNKDLSSI